MSNKFRIITCLHDFTGLYPPWYLPGPSVPTHSYFRGPYLLIIRSARPTLTPYSCNSSKADEVLHGIRSSHACKHHLPLRRRANSVWCACSTFANPFSLRSGNAGSFLPILCYFSLLASSRFSDGASMNHQVHPFFVVCGCIVCGSIPW